MADTAGIEVLFEQAGCAGQLCVQALDGGPEITVGADQSVVSASVFKVALALEAETQFADGRLDPRERICLPAAGRTPGPVGFSLFRDDVEAALGDLVAIMLTISDNPATDVLLHRTGIDTLNASMARLGLTGTVIAADLHTLINSIGQDAGFEDWAGLARWGAQPRAPQEDAAVKGRIAAADALLASRTNRTTARDMVRLLQLIWADQAGPPQACQRVRQLMGQQLTKNRLAAGFGPPARVAAKSGSLVGVVRNEVGVISYPSGRGYAAAVFSQGRQPWQNDAAINAALGTAAAMAVSMLQAASPDGSRARG
jgi:beta-lactamase class A